MWSGGCAFPCCGSLDRCPRSWLLRLAFEIFREPKKRGACWIWDIQSQNLGGGENPGSGLVPIGWNCGGERMDRFGDFDFRLVWWLGIGKNLGKAWQSLDT